MNRDKYYEYDSDTGEIRELDEEEMEKAKIDKWEVAKKIVGACASGCATMVVSRYLKLNMPETSSIYERAIMGIGVYFITGVVGSKVAKYAEQEIEDMHAAFDKMRERKEGEEEGAEDGGED